MFAIYITTEALAKIIKSRNEQWLSIINVQDKIYVDKEVNGKTASIRTGTSPKPTQDKQDDVISSSLQSIICELEYSPLIKRLTDKSNWHEVLDVNPCGLYIIDVTKQQADKIQKQYGVICLSAKEENLPEVPECLIAPTKTIYGVKNRKGWERFKELGEKVPSNTLIIQDRYFFNSDREEDFQDTITNFNNILRCLLPTTFDKSTNYHIMIITDFDKIQNRDCLNIIKKHFDITVEGENDVDFERESIPRQRIEDNQSRDKTNEILSQLFNNTLSLSSECKFKFGEILFNDYRRNQNRLNYLHNNRLRPEVLQFIQKTIIERLTNSIEDLIEEKDVDDRYSILLEILSIPKNHPNYSNTHNRRIMSNYYWIGADHKIKAFRINGNGGNRNVESLAPDQSITCRFLYSSCSTISSTFWGEEDSNSSSEASKIDIGDYPIISHRKWIQVFYNIKRDENSNIKYYKNGELMPPINIENRFFSLKNGEECKYLTITNKNNWNDIDVLDGVYHAQYYKNCIVAAKSSSGEEILQNCMNKIKELFNDSSFEKAKEGDNTFYRIIVSNQYDIRELEVESSNSQEELIEQLTNYPENCFKTEHDAQSVANEIANICGFAPPYPNTRSNS